MPTPDKSAIQPESAPRKCIALLRMGVVTVVTQKMLRNVASQTL
jgi:hypothetical protein